MKKVNNSISLVIVSKFMLTLLLMGMFALAFRITSGEPYGSHIYIRADGSIYPEDAPISTSDNITYTFTDDIHAYLRVKRDNIIIDGAGYTIQNGMISDLPPNAGLELSERANITIKNMKIEILGGIGIRLGGSSNNTIYGVNVTNSGAGIFLIDSPNNVFRNNSMTDNGCNFLIYSTDISGFINDIDVSNTVDGKPMYYWINQHDKQVPEDAGYVALINCKRITVQNQELSKNGQGVLLVNTTESTITKNTMTWHYEGGIYILWSSYNDIYENKVDSVLLYLSSNNLIGRNKIDNFFILAESSNNTIYGNTAEETLLLLSSNNIIINNTWVYIDLLDSAYNVLRSNEEYMFQVRGCQVEHYIQDVDTSNTITDRPIYYWVNKRNMTVPSDAGYVALANCTQMTVQDLDIKDNFQGILIAFTEHSTIRGNILTDNEYGIQLVHSANNVVCENRMANCSNGVRLEGSSSNNHFYGNSMIDNNFGVFTEDSFDNTVSENNITSNRVGIKLMDSSTNNVSYNIIANNSDGILFFGSSNNTISKNDITANGYGIHIKWNSCNNEISDNNISKNLNAIYLEMSSNNSIHSNEITFNKNLGLGFWDSSNYNNVFRNNITNNKKGLFLGKGFFFGPSVNNKIYQNNFVHNAEQAITSTSVVNYWDNGYPYGGNYWSDYNGTDLFSGSYQNRTGSDGIGDTPYIINQYNKDNYPLMKPYNCSISEDLNCDGNVDGKDIILTAWSLGSYPGHLRWNPIADTNGDNEINGIDLVSIAKKFGTTYL